MSSISIRTSGATRTPRTPKRCRKPVHERFPKDLEVGTLYGEAMFLLEPRRGSRDIKAPNVQRILRAFEEVLAINPTHVGACHLYIHLTEATTEPERAEHCADSMRDAIPGASHLNHMPSHTWNLLGRWGDSVRANIQAWQSDQKAAARTGSCDLSIARPAHAMPLPHPWMDKARSPFRQRRTIRNSTSNMLQKHPHAGAFRTLRRHSGTEQAAGENSGDRCGGVGFRPGLRAAARRREGLRPRLSETYPRSRRDSSKAMFRVHNAHDLLGILAPHAGGRNRTFGREVSIAQFRTFTRAVDAVRRVDVRRAGTFAHFRHGTGLDAACWRTSSMPRPNVCIATTSRSIRAMAGR